MPSIFEPQKAIPMVTLLYLPQNARLSLLWMALPLLMVAGE